MSETSHRSPPTSAVEATVGSEDSNESTDYNQACGVEPPASSTIGKQSYFNRHIGLDILSKGSLIFFIPGT